MADFYVSAPGETLPPLPDGPKLCDGTDMRVVHNAFLWGYEKAFGLVRHVPAGDTGRSEFVGQWLADLDASLLEQRAPACALHVGQMRSRRRRRPDAPPPGRS